MRRFLGILSLVLFVASVGLAQEAATETLPAIDQILDKLVQGLGGKEAIQKVTSRQAKGNMDIPAMGAGGTLTMLAKAPNMNFMTIDIPGFGLIQRGFDGKVAWAQDPMSGLTESAGEALAIAKRDAVFHSELALKDLFKTLEVKAKEKIGEKNAYVVAATPPEGKVEKFYFEVESGLIMRHDAEREGPQGSAMIETSFEDYKEVDGVKVPYTIKQVMPAMTIIIKFDEVKHNVELEDSKFAKPAPPAPK